MKWFERLKLAREAKDIKKVHLAKQVGVSAPTITEWERGDTAAPSAANVMKLCRVLNITPEYLMDGASGVGGGFEKTYFGANPRVAEAVTLMEAMPDYELGQVLNIIRTLAQTMPSAAPGR